MDDNNKNKDRAISLLIGAIVGLLVGMFITGVGGIVAYKLIKGRGLDARYAVNRAVSKTVNSMAISSAKGFCLSFEKADENIFEADGNASMEIVKSNATHGKSSLKVTIAPGGEFPGISWEAYGKNVQNWTGAKDFHADIFNNTEDNIPLTIKFKSGRDYPKKSYTTLATLEPLKSNHVSIPISEIANGCSVGEMSYVKFFVESPQKEIVLFFDNVGIGSPGKAQAAVPESSVAGLAFAKSSESQIVNTKQAVYVVSSLDKVFRDGKTLYPPVISEGANLSAAGNEYESFQIVVQAGERALSDVRIEKRDLVDEASGDTIAKSNITTRVVGYVPTKKPYYPVKYIGLWPDPLLPKKSVDIEKGMAQPFWVTLYIPKNARAGVYRTILTVSAKEIAAVEVPVEVRVHDFKLPMTSSLKTAFDFYGHVTSARYTRLEGEGEDAYNNRIGELNEQYMIDMLKHRIDPVLNVDPGSQADLARVERYRAYGLDNFSLGKRGGTFNNNWPTSDEEIEALLPVYRTYGEQLKFNHFLEYQYIYTWDEQDMGNPRIAKICSMIHRAYPALKNMVCFHGFWDPDKNPGWGKDIDIWCFGIDDFNEAKVERLRNYGMEMWMYISGPSGYGTPNLALDFDGMDCRIVPWLCWKYDLKGFLYWCVNWWVKVDPFVSAANTKWEQNGNGLLYYPGENGPIDSLRLEIFRDGMEDYEYLAILRKKIEELNEKGLSGQNAEINKKGLSLLVVDNSIASSMRSFTKNREVLLKRREEIAQAIESIRNILGETTPIVENKNTGTVLFPSASIGAGGDSPLITEDFSKPVEAGNGKTFGDQGQFTFELFRKGTFIIDGSSGYAWQKSGRYNDVAIIRSTKPLPKTYKISAVVGEIDYDLSKIKFVENDPAYKEGPLNENGCYLLAITDVEPTGHHTNDWWHEHRKVCIDVDNNIWGHGMPHPVFMVYFDRNNKLMAFDGTQDKWREKWTNAITYDPAAWYKVEIEKTNDAFIMRIYDKDGKLLKEGSVNLGEIWNEDGEHPDYLVIGDPHENYYQGSMKIKSISIPVESEKM